MTTTQRRFDLSQRELLRLAWFSFSLSEMVAEYRDEQTVQELTLYGTPLAPDGVTPIRLCSGPMLIFRRGTIADDGTFNPDPSAGLCDTENGTGAPADWMLELLADQSAGTGGAPVASIG